MPKSIDPTFSAAELVIASLLASRAEPMYGLQLVRESGGAIARGSIYVLLDRLEDKGLVTSRVAPRNEGESGIPKRQYQLTGAGVRAFRAASAQVPSLIPTLA